jgi:hypothetical protein
MVETKVGNLALKITGIILKTVTGILVVAALGWALLVWLIDKQIHVLTPNDQTFINLNSLGSQLNEFRRNCGAFPSTEQGLRALWNPPPTLRCRDNTAEKRNKVRTFVEQVSKDGWGKQIQYFSDGETFRLEASNGRTIKGP